MIVSYTSQAKPTTAYASQVKPRVRCKVFYGWMFLFTIPSSGFARVTKPALSFSKIAKP